MSVEIRTNNLQVADVLIPDIGLYVPGGGASLILDDNDDITLVKNSVDLAAFFIDDAFGAGSSTLIYVENGTDVDQTQVSDRLARANLPAIQNWFGGWY